MVLLGSRHEAEFVARERRARFPRRNRAPVPCLQRGPRAGGRLRVLRHRLGRASTSPARNPRLNDAKIYGYFVDMVWDGSRKHVRRITALRRSHGRAHRITTEQRGKGEKRRHVLQASKHRNRSGAGRPGGAADDLLRHQLQEAACSRARTSFPSGSQPRDIAVGTSGAEVGDRTCSARSRSPSATSCRARSPSPSRSRRSSPPRRIYEGEQVTLNRFRPLGEQGIKAQLKGRLRALRAAAAASTSC